LLRTSIGRRERMSKSFTAQITMDFEFDEDGYTENEREFLEHNLDEGETLTPRTEDEMRLYAHNELLDILYNSVKYNDLYKMIDVVDRND
jgi:hypothetical protein